MRKGGGIGGVLGLLGGIVCLGCAPAGDSEIAPPSELAASARLGRYLGQEPPGATPELFGPGFVSTGLAERDMAMMPDGSELYYSVQLGGGIFSVIVLSRQTDDGWTRPEVAPFSGRYLDLEPAISPDGSRLFFMSKRPSPGITGELVNEDIWAVERMGDGWGEPYPLGPPVNSEAAEFFPSVTRDGTLYFTRRSEDRTESIYRSRWVDGAYQEVERLGPEVNSGQTRFNAFIAPDESYLIVCTWGSEDSLGGVDYYVVFRSAEDTWSAPRNLGPAVNTATGREWSPYVSPDGRFLFFMSSRTDLEDGLEVGVDDALTYADLLRRHAEPSNGEADIWWVDASLVHDLRPEGF